MHAFEPDSHLSRIETHWTAVFQAHRGPSEDAVQAQSELVRRYGGAVHRYLLASLQDADAADELSQEFADPSPAALVQELIELGLYERCRSTMKRRGLASS
jgi:hypothetical protein